MRSVELGTGDNAKQMSEILKDLLSAQNITQRKFASMMGWTPQNFGQRLKNNTFSAEEWNKMVKLLGYEIRLVELETGIEFEARRKGHGRRVRQVVNGVLYDTYKADALCSDFYQDGVHEYTNGMAFEVYVDAFGRFFVARYVEWEGGIDSISPLHSEVAREICKQYGDEMIIKEVFL